MSSRPTAPERMRRVLALVPWIVANPGHRVSDVAERFGVAERQLLDDLNVVFLVGLPPYSPDALVDVEIDDEGRVSIRLADFFARPLRLTPSQALTLLASSDALLSIPGTDPGGALARALDKLRAALDLTGGDPVDVHLGDADAPVLETLRSAAAGRHEVEMRYYSYGRDEQTRRRVAPWRVFADGGSWYVHGWCHRAGGERLFRVDRIEELTVLDTVSDHEPPPDSATAVFQPAADDPMVTLRIGPGASWVAETYPVTVVERADGRPSVIELVVTARPWLERLLLRLGPDAEVISATGLADADRLGPDAARRILARYRPPPT